VKIEQFLHAKADSLAYNAFLCYAEACLQFIYLFMNSQLGRYYGLRRLRYNVNAKVCYTVIELQQQA